MLEAKPVEITENNLTKWNAVSRKTLFMSFSVDNKSSFLVSQNSDFRN